MPAQDKLTLKKKTIKVTMKDTELVRCTKKDGRYILPWETKSELPTGWDNFKYFFTPSEARIPDEKTLDAEPLTSRMQKDPPRLSNPPDAGIRTTWLGHATVLFQCDGVNILSNPNFDMRGIKYYHPGDDKRYRAPVYSVDDLPRIDIVCISNTHFDLLDLPSVKKLNEKWGDMILWYVPLGVLEWMHKAGCTNVIELDWWKEDHVEFNDHFQPKKSSEEEEEHTSFDVKVICTPSQNFHSRSTDDDNAVLWCSWVVHTPRYKLFICGSTGYAEIFKVIGHKYGPFHISALPIGGYHPVEKFGYSSVTPEQAVQIHRDLLSMCSVATTWGTFNLTNEHYLEPPHRLNAELKRLEMNEMQFYLLKHGESRLTEIKEAPHTEDDDECQAPQVTHHLSEDGDANVEVEADGGMLQNLIDAATGAHADIEADAHGDVEYDGNGHAEFDQAEMDGLMAAAGELEAGAEAGAEADASAGFGVDIGGGGFQVSGGVSFG